MKQEIVITGSEGVIGTVLKKGLADKYDITPLDLPKTDVRDYNTLLQAFPGHFAVIHLAWDTKTDNFTSERLNPDNMRMYENVYRACVQTGVRRAILASSVHADMFHKPRGGDLVGPHQLSHPDSPYGVNKVAMEKLGEWYAKNKGLEVVCIRFGGVGPNNKPAKVTDPNNLFQVAERNVWLSHRDCISLIQKCLEVETIPDNFAIIYGISNNSRRIHDLSNPVGWIPQDDCEEI